MEKWGQLPISFRSVPWRKDVQATVIVGSNEFRSYARTAERAARALRIKLAGLFAYADACQVSDFANARQAQRAAMRAAKEST